MLALEYCRARRLDIFKRPVHIVPMWNRELKREVEGVWPGIGELETTAARSGEWAGMDEPRWGPLIERTFKGSNNHGPISITVRYPESCSVTVYRLKQGTRYSFTSPVFWEEAYAHMGRTEVPNDTWSRRPRGQLHKCAIAASLRAAFPEDISDYAAEEMEGKEIDAGGVVIDGVAETPAVVVEPESDAAPKTQRRTWKELLTELAAKAASATDEDELAELAAGAEATLVFTQAGENVRDELSQILASAMARVRGSDTDERGATQD